MPLCPDNLCRCESQSTVRVHLFLLTIQFLYMIWTFPNFESFYTEFVTFRLNCTSDLGNSDKQTVQFLTENMKLLDRLRIYVVETYVFYYVLTCINLFLFQMCQMDKKCSNDELSSEQKGVRRFFRCRLYLKMLIQLVILSLMVFQGIKAAQTKKYFTIASEIDCSILNAESLEKNFHEDIFMPVLIQLVYFLFVVLVDNLLYFLKAFMTGNLDWGSYHNVSRVDEEKRLQGEEVDEMQQAQKFSFNESRPERKQTLVSPKSTPNFNSDLEMTNGVSKRGSQAEDERQDTG